MGNVQMGDGQGQLPMGKKSIVVQSGHIVQCALHAVQCVCLANCAMCCVLCSVQYAIQNEQRGQCGLQQRSGIQTKGGRGFYSFYICCMYLHKYIKDLEKIIQLFI